MRTITSFSKKTLSLVLSALMVITMLPTFALSSPTTAEAKDVAASEYWTPVTSTDFTQTTWTKNGSYNWYTESSPRVVKNGNKVGDFGMGWSVQFRDNEPEVTVDNGVKFFYNSSSDHNQGLMYMSSYNGQTSKTMFSADANSGTEITSFKIDLEFSLFGQTKANSGNALSERRGENVFFKLCAEDTKYGFESRYSYNYVYYAQESYGRRHMKNNSDIYAASGTQDGGNYVLSTDKSYINENTDYHYIMYVADGWLCSYIADESGNTVISYDPIDVSSYSLSPKDITGLFINGSEFNFFGYEDFENVRYKSIVIYKGNENATLDTSKSKYLYTYFTGDSTNGESLHYALSDDGVNFKPVNDGLPVWDSTASWSITQYPTGSTSGVATSKHVRDPYILNKRNTSTGAITSGYYILATDLNTQNGTNWGNNSKLLVYDVANLQNIDTTTPWVIDTTDMCSSLTGGSVSRAWAPQAIWDNIEGKYMLYWSVGYISGLTKLYYIYTSDFKTFEGAPKQLVYPTFCNNFIDADITYHNGIYYMFFKDEDAKKVYRAIAQRPNGPYQGFTKFSDTGMEGPQLYERTPDGSYAFMTDLYGSGEYNIYRASAPRKINEGEVATTNVNYLSPRHGSVIRITPTEYNEIVSKFGTLTPNTVEYYWANDRSWGANAEQGTVMKDTAGHDFVSAWWSGGATVGGNKIALTDGAVYSQDSQMSEILNGDAYTVDFTYKSAGTNQDGSHVIAAITKGGNGETNDHTYVAITANGKFYVNGSEVTYTNASELSTAATDTSNSHRYRITFNGYATCLMVDNTYVGGVLNEIDMQDSLWLTFGFGRGTVGGNSIDTRISGEFGKVTISPTATTTGHDDDFVNGLCSTNDVDTTQIKTFGGTAYFYNSAATGGYTAGTVVYHDKKSNLDNTDYSNEQDKAYMKLHYYAPRNLVLAYDGTKTVKYPVVFGQKRDGGHSQRIYNAALVAGTNQALQQNWRGYTDVSGSYSLANAPWPGVSGTTQINYVDDSSTYITPDNNNTPRVYGNWITYTGKVNNNNDGSVNTSANYYEKMGDITFRYKGYYSYFGSKTQTLDTTLSGFSVYVINYKPIYDILKESSPTTIDLDGAGSLAAKNIREVREYIVNGDGKWMYTPASKAEALRRLKAVGAVNPNDTSTYTYSNNSATAVSNCATAIKNAYENFIDIPNILELRTFTINYSKYGGVSASEIVTAGNTLANIPSNTAKAHINNSNYHWEYDWTSSTGVWDGTQTPSASHVPHSNETYVETRGANAVHCSYSDWNDSWDPNDDHTAAGWTHHAAAGDANGYSTSSCTVCSGSETVYDPHDAEWEEYVDYIEMIEESGEYTSTSRTNYANAISSTTSGVTEYDKTKSASYITTRNTALSTAADTYLNPLAEYHLLLAQKETRDTNNLDGSGNQVYTYESWVNFASKYKTGKDYYDATTDVEKQDIGKFTFNSETGVVSNTKSEAQNTIESDSAVTNTAQGNLVVVDNASAYTTFENAKTLVTSTLDTRKYTDEGTAYINSQISAADGNVYKTLSAAEATAYNTYTGGGYVAGNKIKRTTTGATDTYTGNVLSASTTLNSAEKKDEYIKKYRVSFTVQDDLDTILENGLINDESAEYKDISYGDTVTLKVPDSRLSNYKVAVWSTTNKDDSGNPTGSQKVSGSTNNQTYDKVVSGNVAVVAELSKTVNDSANYRCNICNVYGNIVEVQYNSSPLATGSGLATVTVNGEALTAAQIPFYNFLSWTVTDRGNKTYDIRPVYEAVEDFDFTVVGGTLSTTKQDYDKKVTVSTSNANFAAWAVRKDGKYQIASYNKSYTFYACADETYVAIVKNGSNYETTDASPVTITASLIDGVVADNDNFAAAYKNGIVNDKIANKKTFISIENTKMTAKKARVFARVTQGATDTASYGMLIRNGNYPEVAQMTPTTADLNRTVTSVIESGQFSYTITSKTSFKQDNISFRAYVDYNALYNGATVNARDYSAVAVATKNA
ncbi:MAG: glycoside hydrolase family 43 protein [Eubacterium sp.]|nr:glycoside hydrolase family 43 protein [Eubacterium sp.]